MPRRPATFTQADIARAIRAAEQCETPREVVLEPDGTIRIVPTKDAPKERLTPGAEIKL